MDRNHVVDTWALGEGTHCKEAGGFSLGWWKDSVSWLWWYLNNSRHLLKFIKLYTYKRWILLNAGSTSIYLTFEMCLELFSGRIWCCHCCDSSLTHLWPGNFGVPQTWPKKKCLEGTVLEKSSSSLTLVLPVFYHHDSDHPKGNSFSFRILLFWGFLA